MEYKTLHIHYAYLYRRVTDKEIQHWSSTLLIHIPASDLSNPPGEGSLRCLIRPRTSAADVSRHPAFNMSRRDMRSCGWCGMESEVAGRVTPCWDGLEGNTDTPHRPILSQNLLDSASAAPSSHLVQVFHQGLIFRQQYLTL